MINEFNSNGYVGKKMSYRAVLAYEDGEKPITKWTKKEIINSVYGFIEDNDIQNESIKNIEKLTLKELRTYFLIRTSWHHTGKYYNETDFYSLDEEYIKNFSDEDYNEILKFRKPKKKKTLEEKSEEVKNKIRLEKAREIYSKLYLIYCSSLTNLNTFKGVVNRWFKGKIDLKNDYEKAIEDLKIISEKELNARKNNINDFYYKKENEKFENDARKYVIDKYTPYKKNNKTIQEIKRFLKWEEN